MLSNVVVQRILYLEIKKLLTLYKIEIKRYFNYSFLDYLKRSLFPKKMNKYFIFFRIIFFLFLIKFIIDVIKIFFNFYYITLNWFFSNLKFSIKFYTDNEIIILIFSKIINFISYFFLFAPLVNLSKQAKKRKMPILGYIFFKIMDKFVRMLWWNPTRFIRRFIPVVRITKFFVVFFGLQPAYAITDFFLRIIAILEFIYLLFSDWILFIRIINYVKQFNKIAGVSYLRKGASLFHIAVMLQKHGFKANPANKYDKIKAFIDYKNYCRTYKKAELPPDYLNNEALDIYVFLLELFSDTRYEIKNLPIKEFFFIIFPYEFLAKLFIFSYYLYVGIVFFLYCVLFPLTFIYLGIGIMSDYFEILRTVYFIFFRDLEDLTKEKDMIWTNIRKNALKKEKVEKLKKQYAPYIAYITKLYNKFINLINKLYETIIR